MPAIHHLLQKRRQAAIEKVRAALRRDPLFEEIPKAELIKRKVADTGWRTSEPIKGINRPLEVFLPDFFPDEPPLISISGGGDDLFLRNPHILKSGALCVLPNSAAIDANRADEVVQLCVQNAIEVVSGSNEEDFRDEFSSYWELGISGKAQQFILVDPIDDLKTSCFAEVLGSFVVVGTSEAAITRWTCAFTGKSEHKGVIRPCLVVDVEKPILPEQYPKTLWDARELVEQVRPELLGVLDRLICESTRFFAILFRQSIEMKAALAGILTIGKGLANKKNIPGFRQGKTPNKLLILRGKHDLRKQPVERGTVQRVDHQWIHTRGGDGADLLNKRVLLVGCGSLGGYVGHLLGRAGVGNLTLLDNDTFKWENVGRHVLGASTVRRSKSKAMCSRLQRDLPHLQIDYFAGDWREWLTVENSERFDQFDLVVSTVGDWSCERPLNMLISRNETPSMIFGWIEPYGIAGHALLVGRSGGCMECGVNAFGHFENRVGQFEHKTLTKEPGGCTYYQEYGPLSVVSVAETVARLAVETLRNSSKSPELRTWIGSIHEIESHGGKVAEKWCQRIDNKLLSQTLVTEWPKLVNCAVCS